MAKRQIRQIRIEGNIAIVPLTKGYEAIIDADDAHLVAGHNWFALVTYRRDGGIRAVYAQRRGRVINGKRRPVAMHRAILGEPDGMDVDHRDCDGLNNRRSNLRAATKSQNQHNRRVSSNSASGVKGVSFVPERGKWLAKISVSGKQKNLGRFNCQTAAAIAYAKASANLHGNFGRTA